MDFSISEERQELVDAAERVFAQYCDDDQIKALSEQSGPVHEHLWQQLAETGMLGLGIGESCGGMGLGLVELCLMLELQGRFVAPVPLLATLVECALVIDQSDNASLRAAVLPRVVDGTLKLSPARPFRGLTSHPPLTARLRSDSQWTLNGVSGMAPYAAVADGFVVAAPVAEHDMLIAYCPRETAGVEVVEQRSISNEVGGQVRFENVDLSPEHVLASGTAGRRLADRQAQQTRIGLAALQVGTLAEALQRTAVYVSERKQFGRPLGAFQAVSQRAADAYMAVEALRGVYLRALSDIDHSRDFALSSRVAKYWVGEAGHRAAHAALHLHGGIGQDLDYPIHRYFLWAKSAERYLGTPDQLAREAGELVADSAASLMDT